MLPNRSPPSSDCLALHIGIDFTVLLRDFNQEELEKCRDNLNSCLEKIQNSNYGPWFDIMGAGIYSVILADLKNVKEDYSSKEWTYQYGVLATMLSIFIAF
ncbi:hypothetical protein L6452_17670 [Arctium lappa]|uniref:Uncharacterized protein n=1 Tax=Arctium lappa TaxID=4217 RepID=A0ACB9C487_ARCLA|nr:hypothetical protein L6452_17670 [Arctium lappa]